ncbi:MAG: cobalt-precorrin 5A hydrolase [Methanobacterium sp.]|nr:cobalt-precorrin 5A hydrolase [Methanobacterium sp.]
MKIAIISVTKNGKILGESLQNKLRTDNTIIKVEIFHKNVKETLSSSFNKFDCIIGIMATGIMVRNICPLIKNKEKDPAVLIIDENGKHVISLLSGHLGGANKLTHKIADIIGSDPVITTSTDINDKLGVDCLANKYYFKLNPVSNIKSINSYLINNQKVWIDYSSNYEYLWNDSEVSSTYGRGNNHSNKLLVSNGIVNLELIEKKIVIGLGSRKNIGTEKILKAINLAIKNLDIPIERINTLATGEMKKNEHGILEAAKLIKKPLKIISESELKNFTNPDMNDSEFVKSKFGIGGVCEPSSLIEAGKNSRLLLRKFSYDGVTVAIALSSN